MIREFNKLNILYTTDDASFTDLSANLVDYNKEDSENVTLADSDYLYIGFSRPINRCYIELSTANTNSGILSVDYYNGSSYTGVTGYHDSTKGLNRSGFVQWDRNIDDEESVAVDSLTRYWYRFSISSTSSAMVIKGINIVFADDRDLKREFEEISEFLPENETSFILKHEASRNHLIQDLRADGRFKEDFSTGYLKDITCFDLLDISQVNVAATYLCLSKIFSNVSDEVDDKYQIRSNNYFKMYKDAMSTFYLDVDLDNDGKQDISERMRANTATLVRR